jgi:hypothetical protein
MPALDPTQPSWLLNPSSALAPSTPSSTTPPAADKPKDAAPPSTGGEVIKFPTPQSGMGQEAALQAIGRLEQERSAVAAAQPSIPKIVPGTRKQARDR